MFGIRFGEALPIEKGAAATSTFGPDCYLISPSIRSPYFDTYAACTSPLVGGVYEIQASRTFDTTPPAGTMQLTPAQVEANRNLGWKTLNAVLADLPASTASRAKIDREVRVMTVRVGHGVTLEVNNALGWEASVSCRHDAKTKKVYRYRLGAF